MQDMALAKAIDDLALELMVKYNFKSQKEINAGLCGFFAGRLVLAFKQTPLFLAEGPGHVFVVCPATRRYYDSEAPYGVELPALLPFYQRNTPCRIDLARQGWKLNTGVIDPEYVATIEENYNKDKAKQQAVEHILLTLGNADSDAVVKIGIDLGV